MRKFLLAVATLSFGLLVSEAALAAPACTNTGSFDKWLEDFKKDAVKQGISPKVMADAAHDLTFDPKVLERDKAQSVFQQTFLQFSDRMVGGPRIPNGQKKIQEHAALFDRIEKTYGVPAPVITAFWGLESDFGAMFGKFRILPSLATLAYDCRRGEFFRGQLLDALRLIQRGDRTVADMTGNWAGEFGGMQITSSDYYKSGVDFDGDGRRDIVNSIPDTLATAANFLKGFGWKRGEPWLQEVRVPEKMKWEEADLTIKHPVRQWKAWGVTAANGALPADTMDASLILPMGRLGPAFLAYPNFQAFLGWNNALVYSTTVAYFATRIAGAPTIDHAGAARITPLTTPQVMELQTQLNKLGYDVGEPDGKVGNGTRAAVKKAQLKLGLPADSYPTTELVDRLRTAKK